MKLYQSLNFTIEGAVATLVLNRPETGNRLNQLVLSELKDAILSVNDDDSIKILLIKAAGEHFCQGLDPDFVQQIRHYTFDQQVADSAFLSDIFLTLYRSTKVVIAQVEGHATGLGAALVAVCDMVWATPETLMTFHEVKYGMIPAIAINFLLRKIGETRTKEILLSGEPISSQQAVDYNIINEVIPAEKIAAYVNQKITKMAIENSGASMQLIKKMIADIQEFPLNKAIDFSARMNAYSRTTEDGKKGLMELGNG
ncbi:MAG: enoyl-CoA hydratase/isomerase family protein [Bacteroidia bacterium]|nr:enoyl-CoA hydratase/isomerase family protein [Bacteroidia bacterium]